MNLALDARDAEPMLELNTTPLIDVLLVLLVMFIITIPVQTHAVKFDLPGSVKPVLPIDRLRNEVAVTAAGQILWNGADVSKDQLAALLVRTRAIDPAPELHLRPDAEARYELVDQVLAITRKAHVSNVGFVGNENYARF